MAMTVGRASGPMSQINVTPLADVIIVLLIVMMIAVPLLDREPGLQLPGARHARADDRDARRVTLVLRANASVWLGKHALPTREALRDELRGRLAGQAEGDRQVWLEADQDLPYAEIDALMRACREAGAEQVALVTDPADRG